MLRNEAQQLTLNSEVKQTQIEGRPFLLFTLNLKGKIGVWLKRLCFRLSLVLGPKVFFNGPQVSRNISTRYQAVRQKKPTNKVTFGVRSSRNL